MKRLSTLFLLALLTACATTTPPATVPAPSDMNGFTEWTEAVPLPVPIRIRVGLASDLDEIRFPRIDGGYVLVPGSGSSLHTRRGFRLIAPRPASAVEYGVQVAALADATSASELAEKIEAAGQESLVVIGAGSGLHKIFAGRFPEQPPATALRARLLTEGYPTDMIVTKLPAPAPFDQVIRIVDDEATEIELSVGSVIIMPAAGETVPIEGRRYRGGAIAHLNDRGLLNAINVLNLEDYVKGVVPNELGPSVYDELEALKAQAMAARTYAIKRRGDFEREGYDICPTPACQVYEGFESEHPLSTRAVEESAGRILTWNGEPIDALYTSTCGGETSDVATMFPGRSEPYLRHVRCVENEFTELAGRRDSETLRPVELQAALFRAFSAVPDSESWSAAAAERSVLSAARVAGIATPAGVSLASLTRAAVLDYLGHALRLDQVQEPLILPEDLEYFFPGSDPRLAIRTAGFINKYRLGPAQLLDTRSLSQPMSREEFQAILFGWLDQQAAIREARGKIASLRDRTMTIKAEGTSRSFQLPDEVRIYRSISDQTREREIVHVLISDRTRVFHDRAGVVRAVIVEGNYDGAAFDRTSSYSSWVRSYSTDELAESIRRRQPIDSVADLVPVSRDQAGRIEVLDVVSQDGSRRTLKGLPVRWSLNVPDNLFSMVRSADPDGKARFTFFGKGWGHGTGMCQVGAFGMASRGHTAEQIVKHFYSGIEVSRVSTE